MTPLPRQAAQSKTPRVSCPATMSDEVSQFLESVERLRGQQIEEDQVRARELEEYLAAKRERQARREGELPSPVLSPVLSRQASASGGRLLP